MRINSVHGLFQGRVSCIMTAVKSDHVYPKTCIPSHSVRWSCNLYGRCHFTAQNTEVKAPPDYRNQLGFQTAISDAVNISQIRSVSLNDRKDMANKISRSR
jgi:hypothetical protein